MLNDLIQKYRSSGIVVQIITWNVVLFLISLLFFYQYKLMIFDFPNYVSFNTNVWYFNFWTVVSYGFFHNGVWHLFFNMLSLYLLSILFFTFFNSKQFLRLYFFGIIFSVLFAYLVNLILGLNDFKVVGASGAIAMLFFSVATFSPHYRINLILFSLEIWILAGVLLLIYITMLYSGDGGNLVHLGGALFGILWGFYIKKGVEISSFLQYIFDINTFFKKESKIKKVHINKNNSNVNNNISNNNQVKIDAILDKISKSGYDSLSNDEKKFLFQFKEK